ncbi:Hypothetical protein FKW44_021139, partial [Caligus rogercresseyi]
LNLLTVEATQAGIFLSSDHDEGWLLLLKRVLSCTGMSSFLNKTGHSDCCGWPDREKSLYEEEIPACVASTMRRFKAVV